MALLHALVTSGYRPIILHFNHGWRAESGSEEKFVQKIARHHRLTFWKGKAPASLLKTEQAARTARWKFFLAASKKFKCRDLVLAHHANDQTETFLLQLLRGSGAAGMISPSERDGIRVHRPWLGVWRREIEAYAAREKIKWHEDATNQETRYRRNWIRHTLIPLLEKQVSPGVSTVLWRAAEIRSAELEWMESQVGEITETLCVAELKSEPLALQRLRIKQWLEHHQIADVSFTDIEAVRGLINQVRPAKINLSQGHHARRTAGVLYLTRKTG